MKYKIFISIIATCIINLFFINTSDFVFVDHWLVLVIISPITFITTLGAIGMCNNWN